MMGPLDFLTTSRSGDMSSPSLAVVVFTSDASLAACWARASGVHVLPVITAAAPMTALRTRKARRSMPAAGGVTAEAMGGTDPLTVTRVGIVMIVLRGSGVWRSGCGLGGGIAA